MSVLGEVLRANDAYAATFGNKADIYDVKTGRLNEVPGATVGG